MKTLKAGFLALSDLRDFWRRYALISPVTIICVLVAIDPFLVLAQRKAPGEEGENI